MTRNRRGIGSFTLMPVSVRFRPRIELPVTDWVTVINLLVKRFRFPVSLFKLLWLFKFFAV